MTFKKNSFFQSEDFAAIIAGSILLAGGLLVYFVSQFSLVQTMQEPLINRLTELETQSSFKGVEWYETLHKLQAIQAGKSEIGSFLKKIGDRPGVWNNNPLESMIITESQAEHVRLQSKSTYDDFRYNLDSLKKVAQAKEEVAGEFSFANDTLNLLANSAIGEWQEYQKSGSGIQKKYQTKSINRFFYTFLLFLLLGGLFAFVNSFSGIKPVSFIRGFAFVFLIALLSHILAGQSAVKEIGFGFPVWAILLGLLISNSFGISGWIKEGIYTELFIKTAIILLGAEILLSKIMAIGLPGIFVAWVVTPIVLILTYWFGQRVLKIKSKTLNITVSADMSVCGVSAAVATAAACKATKEELTVAIGLSMIFTSIMMIVMPLGIKALGMPEILGGAWIGGTIDATGAVVAAGAFLGPDALAVATTIKMIQNILIGVIAFGVAVYFTRSGSAVGSHVGLSEIWRRFPKFVIGFIIACLIFSSLYYFLGDHLGYAMLDSGVVENFTAPVREWLFSLAFVSIGLSINYKELRHQFVGGKPLVLYVCGQTLNLALTLAMAYLMFYVVFPDITSKI